MVKRLWSLAGAKASAWTPNVFQFGCLVAVTIGFALIAAPLGWIMGGLCLGLIGWAVDK